VKGVGRFGAGRHSGALDTAALAILAVEQRVERGLPRRGAWGRQGAGRVRALGRTASSILTERRISEEGERLRTVEAEGVVKLLT